jgi:ATP-dependent helicase HepA
MFVGQPGQRWVSKTEPELGLGLVEHMVARQVVISFPAADESRIYSNSNPPLTRVEYSVGEEIKTNTGDWFTVTQVSSTNACYTYIGVTDTGHTVKIHEQDLDSSVQFNKPLDRLFIGQFDKSSRFQLRIATLTLKHKHQTSNVHGLVGPRVNRLPHQFFIANEVSRREYPRVLLADEVGLGKTIEAGLILHRMLLDGRVATALIVVPDNLLYQWLLEMRRRFNLHFSIIDSQLFSIDDSEQDDPNYRPPQLTLMPISYIKNERKLSQVISYEWDILIVDEAHQLTWDINKKSTEFASVEALASKIPSVILLTATPNQHGVMGHFSRLSLLDPHRYRDLKTFIKEEENYTKVNALVTKLSN